MGRAVGFVVSERQLTSFHLETAISAARPLQLWDGGDPTRYGNGRVNGGPGVWRNGALSWTGQDGIVSKAGKANGFAIFTGNSGQVLIDNSAGAVKTGGLQLATGGYVLSGGTLTWAGGIVRHPRWHGQREVVPDFGQGARLMPTRGMGRGSAIRRISRRRWRWKRSGVI